MSSHLPVLVIQTDGQLVQDRTRTPGSLTVLTPSSEREGSFVPADYGGRAEISVRGNSSFYLQKKSYRLELQDSQGKDRKAPLLGLPADSDWVLYASATDRTFVRNLLGHELWRRTGRYAVRWRLVELFVVTNGGFKEREISTLVRPHPDPLPQERENGAPNSVFCVSQLVAEMPRVLGVISSTNPSAAALSFSNTNDRVAATLVDSYLGVYAVMEKIKRGKDRVNIARLRPEHTSEPEISGGYIIKRDDQGPGERGLLTGQELVVRYEEPKESELTPVQRQWMTKYLDDFEKALFGRNFRDPLTGYPAFLDVDSFVDFHWLVEISHNADGFLFSQYLHKDRGGKLTMGPVWDWDNSLGNPFFSDHRKTNGWRFQAAFDPDYSWYRRLFEDPDFLQRYIDRWSELRTTILATTNILAMVDEIAGGLKGAQVRNAARWEREGPHIPFRARIGVTYEEEMKWLKDWISCRLAWIDSQEFPKPVVQVSRDTPSGPARITMTCPTGRLFYTTNGTDPRMRGGGVSLAGLEYREPIPVATNTSVFARTRSDYGLWSAPVRLDLDASNE